MGNLQRLGTTRLPPSLFRCSSSRSSVCLSAVLLYLRSWFASSKSERNPNPKPEGRLRPQTMARAKVATAATRATRVTPIPSRAPRPDAPEPQSINFAHRVGLWSARHRKKAIFGWLAFVILSFAIATFAVTQQQIV
jgi:hypothetical protein